MNEAKDEKTGFAGKLAAYFINSRLTLLIVIFSMLLGLMAISLLPREEEPQIKVPMIDVMVSHARRHACRRWNNESPSPWKSCSMSCPGSSTSILPQWPARVCWSSGFMSVKIPRRPLSPQPEAGTPTLTGSRRAYPTVGQAALHRRCADSGADLPRWRLRSFYVAAAGRPG